ncbi:hypothetical protein L917_12908 [Phytophthora nicotianae]|uniref:Uncharacterized protein n=1 Tax=Phytophthora nicotianae TaxID=4792 RepID=W2KUD3_PHYNI|nr:hypothetical protein L917_12908 [Phytophthora nicotianae]
MDVLVAEDDALVSLEEALAFIDGYDINEQSLTETLVHCSPVDLFSQITPSELPPPKTPVTTRKHAKPQRKLSESSSSQEDNPNKRRRARSAASSSTRLQQKKRAEIQALREEAQELETQVELLKKSKFLPGDMVLELDDSVFEVSQEKQPSNWHEMAIAQYRERLVSEKTNRRLKSILANQEKVNSALSGLLQKRSVLSGMDYVFTAQSGVDSALLTGEDSSNAQPSEVNKKVMTELEQAVQRMYKEAKTHSKHNKPVSAITCDMRIKHDARRGKVIEFVTTTPMSCSLESATEIVWKEISTYLEYPDKVYNCIRGEKPNTQEKTFVMSLKSPSGMLELNGVQYMEKFEELDQTIFTAAESMVLPAKGLQYRNECWMTVTPSASESNVSIVEIFFQLYMERDDGLIASTEDLAYAQNIVMGSLSNTLRKFFQTQQNALMEKAGRIIVAPIASTKAIL